MHREKTACVAHARVFARILKRTPSRGYTWEQYQCSSEEMGAGGGFTWQLGLTEIRGLPFRDPWVQKGLSKMLRFKSFNVKWSGVDFPKDRPVLLSPPGTADAHAHALGDEYRGSTRGIIRRTIIRQRNGTVR